MKETRLELNLNGHDTLMRVDVCSDKKLPYHTFNALCPMLVTDDGFLSFWWDSSYSK